jgi:hypothetical protein
VEYCGNLYSNKLENLEKIDIFLDTLALPKLNQEGINHLSKTIKSNEIEARAHDQMD